MSTIAPPTPEEYKREVLSLLQYFAPRIYTCQKCGWPVATGYCCTTCRDTSPDVKEEEECTQPSIK